MFFFFFQVILCSITHNSKKVETAQTSINNEWVKNKISYTYSGIPFSLKQEGESDIWRNLEDSVLSEVSLLQKDKRRWFQLHEVLECPTKGNKKQMGLPEVGGACAVWWGQHFGLRDERSGAPWHHGVNRVLLNWPCDGGEGGKFCAMCIFNTSKHF